MNEVNYRVEWVKNQLRERAKEKERAAYSHVDWHDFVIVEIVDYQLLEQGNFPLPTAPEMTKTIQKPPQFSPLVTKLLVTIVVPPQRTIVTTPRIPPAGIQPVAILPQATIRSSPSPIEEPPLNKLKTEDQLIPEEEFYKTHGKIPEKPEWNLNGQTIPLTLPITDLISVTKVKLSDLLGGIPAGRRKLVYKEIFVKDSTSLKFYNMTKGAAIYLQSKELGDRKK